MKNLKWENVPQNPGALRGRTTVEDNFSPEDKKSLLIFIRELIQNIIDSKTHKKSDLKININTWQCGKGADIEPTALKKLFSEISEPLNKTGSNYSEDICDSGLVLVVEEEGSSGLTGQYKSNNKPGGHWNSFWFTEGKTGKPGKGNLGGAGQGKITYHLNSAVRTVFAVTKRVDDDKELMFGKAYLKETFLNSKGKAFDRVIYWSKTDDKDEKLPEENPTCIKEFKKLFKITRKTPGTSWVIPFVNKETFTTAAIIKALISEYYFLFIYGDFTAEVNKEVINSDNIQELIKDYELEKDLTPDFLKFLLDTRTSPEKDEFKLPADWAPTLIGQNPIEKGIFKEGELEILQKKFDDGKVLAFSCPVDIIHQSGKTEPSLFKCYIQKHANHLFDHYIRGGMRIDKENHLKSTTSAGFGLMYVDGGPVFDFLKHCEDASHRKWNRNTLNESGLYKSSSVLEIVRHSLPKLFKLFSDTTETKRDESSLMDLFSMPKIQPPDVPQPSPNPNPNPKPSPNPQPFPLLNEPKYNIEFLPNKIKISATEYGETCVFPREIKVRLALDKPTGNIWTQYHPFDFNLSNQVEYPILTMNSNLGQYDRNKANFVLRSKDFVIEIKGFTNDLQLVCEVNDA